MELTIKEAYKLCVQKWTALSKHDFSIPLKGQGHYTNLLRETNPKIVMCNGYCGYCEFYRGECHAGCPLVIDGKSCFDAGHPFDYWCGNECKEAAQKVLDLIIKTKPNYEQTTK